LIKEYIKETTASKNNTSYV